MLPMSQSSGIMRQAHGPQDLVQPRHAVMFSNQILPHQCLMSCGIVQPPTRSASKLSPHAAFSTTCVMLLPCEHNQPYLSRPSRPAQSLAACESRLHVPSECWGCQSM
jgi:hypothetical protein